MLGKRPAIGKLAGAIRASIIDPTTSPNSPLGSIKSPSKPNKSSTSYNIDGVGLGIVAALDKSNNNNTTHGDHQGNKVLARYAIYGPLSAQSGPIRAEDGEKGGILGGLDEGYSSIITNVTYHGTCTRSIMASRVYHEASVSGSSRESVVVSNISPARLAGDRHFSGPDFLSSCHLCKKALHGKDVYMYGGEKAFCSRECRQRQIRMDERKERFKSSEPHCYTTTNTTQGEIFFSTGVVAV